MLIFSYIRATSSSPFLSYHSCFSFSTFHRAKYDKNIATQFYHDWKILVFYKAFVTLITKSLWHYWRQSHNDKSSTFVSTSSRTLDSQPLERQEQWNSCWSSPYLSASARLDFAALLETGLALQDVWLWVKPPECAMMMADAGAVKWASNGITSKSCCPPDATLAWKPAKELAMLVVSVMGLATMTT